MSMPDDASLLARYARHRDPDAFATLVERHAGLVYGTCLRQCGDRALAEDASQECFLALATHAAEIRQSLTAWLHTVALHAASRLGRKRREQSLSQADAVSVPVSLAPEVAAAWRDLEPHLDQALTELPAELRSAVMLRYLDGQTQQQVAQTLGLSQATVSRRIASGITQLRQRLVQHWDDQALGAALGCATVTASPALVAHAAKIGLAGIGAPLAATTPLAQPTALVLTACLTVAASLGLIVALRHGHDGSPRPQRRATPAPAAQVAADPPVVVPASPLPALPITACVHGWPLDRVVALIDDQLPYQTGTHLELMPVDDYPLVDLRCDAAPLHTVLDQLLGPSGWRWRSVGSVVTIDRPLAPAAASDLLTLLAAPDPGSHATAAQSMVASGDLDACAALLGSLAGSDLDTQAITDARAAQGRQRDVFTALALTGGSWQTFVPRGNPLGYLAASPQAQQGLLASWQRCRRMGWPITFFQCYLAGELRVTALGPQLLDLVNDPARFLPHLASRGPCQRAVIQHLRLWAEHALGRMAYRPALPPLCDRLPAAGLDECLALTGALGELGDPAALPRMTALPNHPWTWFWGVTDFQATQRLVQVLKPYSDQPLATLLATSPPVQWGLGDTFICCPTMLELPTICTTPADTSWWTRLGFWLGTGRLPASQVSTVVAAHRRTAAPADAMLDDAVLARAGDDAALERVLLAAVGTTAAAHLGAVTSLALGDATALTSEPTLDIASALAARLSPVRGDAMAKRLLELMQGRPWTQAVLSLLHASHPAGLSQRLIADYPSATAVVRGAMLRYLADERSPAGRAFILAQAVDATDAIHMAEALHAPQLDDPLLRRALISLPMDAGGVACASHGLELFPDSVMHCYDLLMHAAHGEVTPEMVATFAAAPDIRFATDVLDSLHDALVLHLFVRAQDPQLRAACCTWLDNNMVCDERPLRGLVLTRVIKALALERDPAAAKAERQLLTDFLAELADSGDGRSAFYHEDIQMDGGWDNLDSIASLDDQVPAVRAALVPPAPTTVKPASNF